MINSKNSAELTLGVVTDVKLTVQGIPEMTVQNASGSLYNPCYVASFVAGADARFSLSAPNVGSRVILLVNPIPNVRSCFIIGGVLHPEDSMAISVDGVPQAQEGEFGVFAAENREPYYINQDYKLTHLTDVHIQNLNSFINLSDMHGLTLQGSPRVSVQLPANDEYAVFRVAAGGLALNTVLNANPFLNRLFDYLETMKAKIDALETMINLINPALINVMNSTGVLLNAATPGSGTALIEQSTQVANGATELDLNPEIRPASDVRAEAEADKNPYILLP